MQTCGSTSQTCSIISRSRRLSMTQSSACMRGFLRMSSALTKSGFWIDSRRSHTKVTRLSLTSTTHLLPTSFSISQYNILFLFFPLLINYVGPLADLMWSDPDPEKDGFQPNTRGVGYTYGADTVTKFLKINKIDHIIRSHQLCMDGYQVLSPSLSLLPSTYLSFFSKTK